MRALVIFFVVEIAASAVAVWLILRAKRPSAFWPNEECPLCNGGRGREISFKRAHVFAESWLEDRASGLSTGVSVAYCARHCPGGCSRGCKVRS